VIFALVGLVLSLLWWGLLSLERFRVPFQRAATRLRGHLLEVLLYGGYPRVMLSGLRDLVGASARLSLSLVWPCLLFTPPLLLGFALASSFTAFRPASPAEPIVVALEESEGGVGKDWTLEPSPQFVVEIDFRHPRRKARFWRIRPRAEGRLELTFRREEATVVKRLWVGRPGEQCMLLPVSHALGWKWLLTPLEPPLAGGLETLSVEYPARIWGWNGWSVPWWALLLLSFLGWSWLLTLLPQPGNWPLRR
jgi:hypothetical protein